MVQKGIKIMKNQITGKITGAVNKASMFTGAWLTAGLMMLENTMAANNGFTGYANAPDGTTVVDGAKSFIGAAGTFVGAIWVSQQYLHLLWQSEMRTMRDVTKRFLMLSAVVFFVH